MKNKRFWITASIICIILGIILTAAGRLMGGHAGFYIDQNGVHAAGNTEMAEPIQDSMDLKGFDSLEIHADYADVELILSDKFSVEYCLRGTSGKPVCEVKNGRFIFQESKRSHSFNMGFFTGTMGVVFHEPRYFVKVTIPKKTKLSEAVFDIESGDLAISSIQADTLKIDDEYGDVNLEQYDGKALDIRLESGNLSLGTVNAAQADLRNEYGEIKISEAAGNNLTVQMESCGLKADRINFSDTEMSNEYGSVTIADAAGDRLTMRMESGDCKIKQMDFSDTKITNSYGDVCLGISGKTETYGLNLKTEYGDIRVGNQRIGDDGDEIIYTSAGDSPKKIAVSCENGNIEIQSAK